jgi:hypothetical protein
VTGLVTTRPWASLGMSLQQITMHIWICMRRREYFQFALHTGCSSIPQSKVRHGSRAMLDHPIRQTKLMIGFLCGKCKFPPNFMCFYGGWPSIPSRQLMCCIIGTWQRNGLAHCVVRGTHGDTLSWSAPWHGACGLCYPRI